MIEFNHVQIADDDGLWIVKCTWGEVCKLLMNPVSWVDSLNQYIVFSTEDTSGLKRIHLTDHFTITIEPPPAVKGPAGQSLRDFMKSADLDTPTVLVQGISGTGFLTVQAIPPDALKLLLTFPAAHSFEEASLQPLIDRLLTSNLLTVGLFSSLGVPIALFDPLGVLTGDQGSPPDGPPPSLESVVKLTPQQFVGVADWFKDNGPQLRLRSTDVEAA